MNQDYRRDVEKILSTQGINGGAYWSTPEGGIAKGTPFSTLEVGLMLHELGYPKEKVELQGIAELIFGKIRKDGRIQVYPSGTIYPCQTAIAARTLCYLGYAEDPRLAAIYDYFFNISLYRYRRLSISMTIRTQRSRYSRVCTASDSEGMRRRGMRWRDSGKRSGYREKLGKGEARPRTSLFFTDTKSFSSTRPYYRTAWEERPPLSRA